MASREELQAARANALNRTRAAGKKISRIKTSREVNIAGSKHDPRKPAAVISKMTTRQVTAYTAKVDKFLSRETQFVQGARNAILPTNGRFGVQSYNKLQAQINKDKKAALKKIQDIFIKSAGMTIGERIEAVTPKHPVTAAPASYAPHIPFVKTPKGITSEKSLKALVKQMEKDQNGGYFDRKFKSQYAAAKQMIYGKDGIKNSKLTKEFKSLNPTEFSLLWNYTNFAEVTSTDYVIRKSLYHDNRELAWYDDNMQTQLREASKRIGEIKSLKLGGRL